MCVCDLAVLEPKIDLALLHASHQENGRPVKRYINNDDLTVMAIIKTMITTVIILKSMMIKMIVSDNNDNETMNAQISLHIYMKGF